MPNIEAIFYHEDFWIFGLVLHSPYIPLFRLSPLISSFATIEEIRGTTDLVLDVTFQAQNGITKNNILEPLSACIYDL